MEIKWKTVNEVLECARSWNPNARLIGNVTAGDIADMCCSIINEGQKQLNKQNTLCSCKKYGNFRKCPLCGDDIFYQTV